MSFSERLNCGTFPVALEITPPVTPTPAVLIRRASALGNSIASSDVVERIDRQSSLHAASQLLESGYDPIWHLITNGASREDIIAQVLKATDGGLNQALFIRGDNNPKPGKLTVTEAIRVAVETAPYIYMGVAFNQHAKNLRTQIENAAAKAEAGARYVQTQPVLNLEEEVQAKVRNYGRL